MKKERKNGLLGLTVFVLAILFFMITQHYEEVETCGGEAGDAVLMEQGRKKVALTFDDGPDEKITRKVLKVLKEKKVPATFFCVGEKIEKNKKVLKQIINEGHEIGNHTYTHCDLCTITQERQVEEVMKTSEIINKVTGQETIWLRPPFGKIKKGTLSDDYIYVGWTVDTLDWCSNSVESITRRVEKQLHEGGIILMHDQYQNTLLSLPYIIDWVRQQGYEFVTLGELFFGD